MSSCGVVGGSSSVGWEAGEGEYGEVVENSAVDVVEAGDVGRMCCLGGRFLGGRWGLGVKDGSRSVVDLWNAEGGDDCCILEDGGGTGVRSCKNGVGGVAKLEIVSVGESGVGGEVVILVAV